MIFAIIDQLEEVFFDARESKYRDEFFRDLAEALRTVSRLRIMLSIRTEYLPELARYMKLLRFPIRLMFRFRT